MNAGDKPVVTLTQLRRWERMLSSMHSKAGIIMDEAEAAFGKDDENTILLSDPIIEIGVAHGIVETLIEDRLDEIAARKGKSNDQHPQPDRR